MSYPPPLPVSPLGYDMVSGMRHGRPGIITAIGVMSIVVACLSGIVSLGGAFYAFTIFAVTKMPVPMPVATTIPAAAATTAPGAQPTAGADDGSSTVGTGTGTGTGAGTGAAPAGGVVTVGGVEVTAAESEDALNDEQRQMVITTLTRMSGLSDARQKHLDLLLSVAGKRVMPVATSPAITMQKIRANVTDVGILPSVAGDGRGPNYFLVGTGRLECYDDHAVFRPDGSTDVVSASTSAASTEDGSGAAAASATPRAAGMRTRGRSSSPPPFAVKNMSFRVNPLAAVGTVLGELASAALAIYLLVIGMLVLRDVRAGGKLHWWYVALKVPLVIVTAVSWWVVWRDVTNSVSAFFTANPLPGMPPGMPPTGAFGAIGGVLAMWLTFAALIALLYPVALAVALGSRSVRDYYRSVRYERY